MIYKKNSLTDEQKLLTKLAAYDALIEFNADSLPIEFPESFKFSDIFVLPMQFVFEQTGDRDESVEDPGLLMCSVNPAGNHYIILINEKCDEIERRWTIAQLLSLIKLGAADDQPGEYLSISNLKGTYREFALQLTCPDVILKECGIVDYKDIMLYCGIPFRRSVEKSKTLKLPALRNTFRTYENVLINNFKKFIHSFK